MKMLYESDSDLDRDFDAMAATGATWVRVDVAWSAIEQSRGVFSWKPIDRFIAVGKRGQVYFFVPAVEQVVVEDQPLNHIGCRIQLGSA